MTKRLETVSGEVLMNTPLEETRMIVEGLIPQGLHILGGAPKFGKSWLVLWMCVQIAMGESIWDYKTEKGTTLYLCLEDSFCRIQNRLFDITDNAPGNVHFATMADTIGGGLVKQIEMFMSDHPETNFIAIDTLQRVRNPSGDINAYANDYKDINVLKGIADKHKIAILLVHHLRKQGDDDPMNMISGTTGLTGAVDSIYVLKKDSRKSNKAKLIATGRDIEYRELTLEFDKQSHIWNFISDDSEEDETYFSFADNTLAEIIDFIKSEQIFIGTATELATRMNTKTLPNILSKKLVQNQKMLTKLGVEFSSSRTGQKREITLIYDGNDSNDGNIDSGLVSNLLSQPS